MGFVDINGKPLDLARLATPKRTRVTAPKEPTHKGFQVTGISPAQIDEARKEHAAKGKGDFDLQAWSRNAKPTRVSKRPYATQAGAEEARALAVRQGWINVHVTSVTSA